MTGHVKDDRPAMLNVGSYWRATVLESLLVIHIHLGDLCHLERTSCLRVGWSLGTGFETSYVQRRLAKTLCVVTARSVMLVTLRAMYQTNRHPGRSQIFEGKAGEDGRMLWAGMLE